MVRVAFIVLFALSASASSHSPREAALLETWDAALETGKATDTPVTRVVNLLKEMQEQLKKEMDEDEELYHQLACWCNNGQYEKSQSIEAAETEIEKLEALIERLTAQIEELKATIKETSDKLEADKAELAEATELRNKQLKEFHGTELDAIQNIENLKAAIIVLGKHHGAFPQLSLSLLGLGVSSHHKNQKNFHDPEEEADRELETFMRQNDYVDALGVKATDRAVTKFLQEPHGVDAPVTPPHAKSVHGSTGAWSTKDKAVVARAVRTASAFLQSHGRETYNPGYASQSGEILGVMKQLKEEMEGDLSEDQKKEAERAAAFAELREAKTAEIAAGEKMLEEKKAELAQAQFDVANAKEDLEEVQAQLAEDQKFLANLKKICADAEKNFELRKKSRLEEIQAVSETIEILTDDEARDKMNGAYAFLQLSMGARRISFQRSRAAKLLRDAALRMKSPQLSVLATSVELDAFTKVKKMIDDLVAMLKTQQEDEVKKHDWCLAEFQENDMQTMKADDLKADQIQKIDDLGVAIKTYTEEIEAAKTAIADNQMNLQRSGEQRVKQNLDFQKTVADQKATQEILAKALDRLATFYDAQFLVQVGRHGRIQQTHKANSNGQKKQAPPVPQMEYKPSAGAGGIMSMIEKLIYDAKELEADSYKSEAEAQTAYETFVADTNTAIKELQATVATKSEEKAKAEVELTETEEGLQNTMKDLEDLSKYKAGLHEDCDYLMKNFGIRQESRQAEIESLQQAKQILSGAQ